jgi:hypothetical protein
MVDLCKKGRELPALLVMPCLFFIFLGSFGLGGRLRCGLLSPWGHVTLPGAVMVQHAAEEEHAHGPKEKKGEENESQQSG